MQVEGNISNIIHWDVVDAAHTSGVNDVMRAVDVGIWYRCEAVVTEVCDVLTPELREELNVF